MDDPTDRETAKRRASTRVYHDKQTGLSGTPPQRAWRKERRDSAREPRRPTAPPPPARHTPHERSTMGERRRETSAHPRIPNAKRTRIDRVSNSAATTSARGCSPQGPNPPTPPTTTRRGHHSLNSSSRICRLNRRRRLSIPPPSIDAARRTARPPAE